MDFNLACLCALANDVDGAVRHGAYALDKGYSVREFDDAVHDEPAFAALLAVHDHTKRRRHED